MINTAILFASLGFASAQWAGNIVPETHPPLSWKQCSSAGGCETVQSEVVLDENWRWLRDVGGFSDCFRDNDWTYETCSTTETCTNGCALEGVDYEFARGIKTSDDTISLKYVTNPGYEPVANSRVFLMESETRYKTFTLMDNEIAFDVNLSKVDCGINAALYFVAMDPDGGVAEFPTNRAGAKFGTGYCDASCPQSQRFVGGKANIDGWEPSPSDPAGGMGNLGACCSEFDVWNSNANSYSMSSKLCHKDGYGVCHDEDCNQPRYPECDRWGCDYNPYRLGVTDFYGKGKTVDTNKPFTVVTRFRKDEVTQFFIQDGQKIETPAPAWDNFSDTSGLNPEHCESTATEFLEVDRFLQLGGFPRHNEVLRQPMVLAMAITDDHWAWNTWLDSVYPPDNAGAPGTVRGECLWRRNEPRIQILEQPDATVVWSDIRFGPIGSTVSF